MGFYKNIGTEIREVTVDDFQVHYAGEIPSIYDIPFGTPCHMKYYGKEYYFTIQCNLPDITYDPHRVGKCCGKCIFFNPKSTIYNDINRCRIRTHNSPYTGNRCIKQGDIYFEPLIKNEDK